MQVSDWIAIISLVIAVLALAYSIFSNTKKYELTYQYYNDILSWHSQVVETLISLRFTSSDKEEKKKCLVKLSSLIENGRFYFPNINKNDGYGKKKPHAYQGYRNVVLDFLVFEYQLFQMPNSDRYLEHSESLQRLFTSYVFEYLKPEEQSKKIKKNTHIAGIENFTINDFLEKTPDAIYALYPINNNDEVWHSIPTQRKN